jgi:hypothetical protein
MTGSARSVEIRLGLKETGVLFHPALKNICKSNRGDPDAKWIFDATNRPTILSFLLEMSWDDWQALFNNEDGNLRKTYIAEKRPTSVVIAGTSYSDCYMSAAIFTYSNHTSHRIDNYRNVMFKENLGLELEGEYVRVERAEGVRLGDVWDELRDVLELHCTCHVECFDGWKDNQECRSCLAELNLKLCWNRGA